MSKALVNVETNIDEGIKFASALTDTVPENADEAAEIIGNEFIQNSRRVMMQNRSVVTGTGINSFRNRETGYGKRSIEAAAYLKFVDRGTQSHQPSITNYRFKEAARQYGLSQIELARSIARNGTRPHPWIKKATDITRQSSEARLKIKIDEAVAEANTKS